VDRLPTVLSAYGWEQETAAGLLGFHGKLGRKLGKLGVHDGLLWR